MHGRPLDIEDVYDAQVDAADLGHVVVDQANAARRIGRVDRDLFVQFAAHAFLIGVPAAVGAGVNGRDMPANAHAPLAMQASLALAAAARVLKDRLASRRRRNAGR